MCDGVVSVRNVSFLAGTVADICRARHVHDRKRADPKLLGVASRLFSEPSVSFIFCPAVASPFNRCARGSPKNQRWTLGRCRPLGALGERRNCCGGRQPTPGVVVQLRPLRLGGERRRIVSSWGLSLSMKQPVSRVVAQRVIGDRRSRVPVGPGSAPEEATGQNGSHPDCCVSISRVTPSRGGSLALFFLSPKVAAIHPIDHLTPARTSSRDGFDLFFAAALTTHHSPTNAYRHPRIFLSAFVPCFLCWPLRCLLLPLHCFAAPGSATQTFSSHRERSGLESGSTSPTSGVRAGTRSAWKFKPRTPLRTTTLYAAGAPAPSATIARGTATKAICLTWRLTQERRTTLSMCIQRWVGAASSANIPRCMCAAPVSKVKRIVAEKSWLLVSVLFCRPMRAVAVAVVVKHALSPSQFFPFGCRCRTKPNSTTPERFDGYYVDT